MIHCIPVFWDTEGNPVDSKALLDELLCNSMFHDLTFLNRPQWFVKGIPAGKQSSSITVSLIDTDGSRLAAMIAHPPSIFGGLTADEKYVTLPVIRSCDRCHVLDHTVSHCPLKKGTTICPICGGSHLTKSHHTRCPKAPRNGSITCKYPPSCINYVRAKNHGRRRNAVTHNCPLRKRYHPHANHTGDSSDEERHAVARMVGDPVPSSQPVLQTVSLPTTLPRPHHLTSHPLPKHYASWGPHDPTWGGAAQGSVNRPRLMSTEEFAISCGCSHAKFLSDAFAAESIMEQLTGRSHPGSPLIHQ